MSLSEVSDSAIPPEVSKVMSDLGYEHDADNRRFIRVLYVQSMFEHPNLESPRTKMAFLSKIHREHIAFKHSIMLALQADIDMIESALSKEMKKAGD